MPPRSSPLRPLSLILAVALIAGGAGARGERPADLILHGGRIATVDARFTIAPALAVRDGRVLAVGSDAAVLRLRGPDTRLVALRGGMVLPGLIDSHVHPNAACMTEFDHEIPTFEGIADVLAYIRRRAAALGEGKWIELRQVFITRLKEQRYPTRAELDEAAPRNPVVFATGPDASLNTLALTASGIDAAFRVTDGGPGHAEKDPRTGEPTGILRSCTRYVKATLSGRRPTEEDRRTRLLALFRDYLKVGITAVADRDASAEDVERYRALQRDLPLRVHLHQHVDTLGPLAEIQDRIRRIGQDPLRKPDPMLRLLGVKTYLDGGMLTGSAYMREPWGVSPIYSITDPEYRGVRFIPHERLVPLVRTAAEAGLQFTAHSVGDGAVHGLLDAYEEAARDTPLARTRPCITHCNFMSAEAIARMRRLGVVADIQPDWLHLDGRTLAGHFGYPRLRWFQPLRSLFAAGVTVGGGTDHMQKIGATRSVNPYNPFLGMWIAVARQPRGYPGRLHAEEALTREQALRFYTVNNAYLLHREKELGSLEPGKRADFILVDRDILGCPLAELPETRVLATYVDGVRR
jgi:predicted amidohydrolase YtcJ